METFKRSAVIGSGRWGTSIALHLASNGHDVDLMTSYPSTFIHMMEKRESPRLAGYTLPENIRPVMLNVPDELDYEIFIIAVPIVFARRSLKNLPLPDGAVLVGVNKGMEVERLALMPDIAAELFPKCSYAHLGGPCFPDGLLDETSPVAETIACEDGDLAERLRVYFSSPKFRVYKSLDVKGVALLGALKNVYAIAAGIIQEKGYKEEALAVMLTRALSEITRLCAALGVKPESVYGLSGLGDLMLTCYSAGNSKNKQFGRYVAQGMTADDIFHLTKNSEAEGFFTARALHDLSARHGVEMPLAEAVYQALYQKTDLDELIRGLFSRPPKFE